MPNISIIIPVYNVSPYITECLESVQAQTFTDFEAILVNDGSTDTSGKICDWFAAQDTRFRVIHKENGGVSSARNAGLDVAAGEYLAFIDSDDYVNKSFIATLYEGIKNGKHNISQSAVFAIEEGGSSPILHSGYRAREFFGMEEIIDALLYSGDMQGGCWGKLYDRKTWGNTLFPDDISLSEDLSAFVEVLANTKSIIVCPEATYYYRLRNGSLCHGRITTERLKGAFSSNEAAAKVLLSIAPNRKKEIEFFKFSSNINCVSMAAAGVTAEKSKGSILYKVFHCE